MNPVATVAVTTVTVASNLSYAQPATPPEVPASTASGLKYVEAASSPTTQSVPPHTSEEVSQMISRPKTPIDFVRNFKFIFDHDLLLKDEFFSEENLKNFFNLNEVKVNTDPVGADRNISFAANPPESIFPRIKASDFFGGWATGAGMVSGKTTHQSGLVTAAINFSMVEVGPDFDTAQKIFAEKFVRLPPEPYRHGGPPAATAPHGNEIWRYTLAGDQIEKTLTVGFNPAGKLSNILIKIEKH
ncbi:hypothetical protein KZJ38_33380 [Paraburkholderia edwinii]|uniref:Uncharacterized protein n=1 Tax=Paraburkholderia edwinii TaxID=2861782 RepID=A0ABX8UY12_9BURK|nr:hypothetical protein [Paraburkholderia edwinii]QYD71859.1 hypothetical protein KZJ38_33380 [Paraburkholderia edwinii]